MWGPHERKRARERERERERGRDALSLSLSLSLCLYGFSVQKEGGVMAGWALIKLTPGTASPLVHTHLHRVHAHGNSQTHSNIYKAGEHTHAHTHTHTHTHTHRTSSSVLKGQMLSPSLSLQAQLVVEEYSIPCRRTAAGRALLECACVCQVVSSQTRPDPNGSMSPDAQTRTDIQINECDIKMTRGAVKVMHSGHRASLLCSALWEVLRCGVGVLRV